jgi:hypothetical protein
LETSLAQISSPLQPVTLAPRWFSTSPPEGPWHHAAAKVLAETGEAMNCQDMIKAMAEKGYWTSPGGKDARGDPLLSNTQGGEDQRKRRPVQEDGAG